MWPARRTASTLNGAMTTLLERAEGQPVRNVQALFAHARRRTASGPGNVREVELDLAGPPLRARSRLLTSRALLFVQGENQAGEDLRLRHEAAAPLVAVHATLRGTATSAMDGLGTVLANRAGEVQLFASPSSHTTVRLQAHVQNEAFRVAIAPPLITALAARHPELETLAAHVDARKPFCAPATTAVPLARLIEEASGIMNSEHYGSLRPLFLESRALGWLTLAMAVPAEPSHGCLSPREINRMHDARELLLSRLADPPTLGELALAVGTNDFALKRQFKIVFGQPVYAYLLAIRLAHACRLLKDTGRSVKEIAAAVGYAHANHFGTAFRKAYGVSPARYRALQKHLPAGK